MEGIPSLHRNKPISPPSKEAPPHERGLRNHRLVRFFPLLLLTIYSVTSILRLASSSDSLNTVKTSFVAETSKDVDSLKTHISSKENHRLQVHEEEGEVALSVSCSSLISGQMDSTTSARKDTRLLCCDRSHHRTDICYMTGDVRTDSNMTSIFAYGSDGQPEKIRPYTRKWETNIMKTIDEVTLVPTTVNGTRSRSRLACDVSHGVPAVVFSTGGYTGNLYHEFNDGLIPLYITAERFAGEVVLVVLEYHTWWVTKYESIVKRLSNYKLVDFQRDRRVHCFPEVIIGLKIHGELAIDPQLLPNGKGIQDFQGLLRQGFGIEGQITKQQQPVPMLLLPSSTGHKKKPRIAIFIRNKSRVLLNLKDIVKRCLKIGFEVQILNPKRTTPLPEIFAALDSADAMLAVHGAAMTHFLFMRPGSVLMQIVPLGLDWAADEYYGQPARKLGLEYMAYKLLPEESSLSKEYGRNDPVIADPSVITSRGWQETKRIYLERQDVRINLRRFNPLLVKAHAQVISK